MRRIALLLIAAASLAGCGDSGSADSQADTRLTVLHTPTTTTASGPPTGPLARICDRALAAEITPILSEHGFGAPLERRPQASGAGRLSACDLGPVELSLDGAHDAVQRYQNRIVETTQFSRSEPDRVPRPVNGIGEADLGPAGANWIPFLHQLLSARGKRVLIATVNGGGLGDARRLETAKAVSLVVWDRLG